MPFRATGRTRVTALAAALVVLGLAAAPAGAAPAPASPVPECSAATGGASAPDARALCGALAGLPDGDATAALVRVGGTDGTWRGGAGVRDLPSGRAAHPDALFRAGSTTKAVTAAVVLQLAAEGRVDLGGPARAYLPGLLPARFRHVTVRQLLNHTSGIPAGDAFGDSFEEAYAHRFDTLTPQELVASAVAKGPEFAPGRRQHYLNINYTLLGLLVEEVTGRPYESEAARRVLRPAGMRHTYFPGADPRIDGPHNRGYQAVPRADGGRRFVDVTEWNSSGSWAAGDMISTTADLERLVTHLFRATSCRGRS
ncbi:hypothetical protein GCM10010358_59180 [Streptomyces minutiscleroticus]|uniref:Beta-lactamase-related domain-containing protein n=1 Tax=Streptomyces minutiscleroticus TaxID=68238 RepID=A0A918NUL3_9ACTN|nr:hypothetical protein GCM10010358_59180 [Streptomyces minutiscleroticus]